MQLEVLAVKSCERGPWYLILDVVPAALGFRYSQRRRQSTWVKKSSDFAIGLAKLKRPNG
jgi:hypothetical protein